MAVDESKTVLDWFKETNIQAAIISPIISAIIAVTAFMVQDQWRKKTVLADLIQEVEALAIEHWCVGKKSDHRFRTVNLQNKLQTLSWRIGRSKGAQEAMIELRQTITGGDFDNPNKGNLNYNDSHVTLMKEKCRRLRKALKLKKYH
jgi:hypothetical protein